MSYRLINLYARYKKIIRGFLFILGLTFVFFLVKESWNEVSGLITNVDYLIFYLSVAIGLFGNITSALLFNGLLKKHGVNISNALAIKMHFIGQVAKYIPGKIWGIAYQATHLNGISGATSVMLANIELTLAMMLVTSTVALTLLSLYINQSFALLFLLLGMLVFILIYKTSIIYKMLRIFPVYSKLKNILNEYNEQATSCMMAGIFFIFSTLFYVASNFFMLYAVYGFQISESYIFVGLLSIAWVGGVIAFIVPAGLGVREFLFLILSGFLIPEESLSLLASIAIVSRFWQIIQDIFAIPFLVFLKEV